MKITKSQLKRLIKEELGKVLREATGKRTGRPDQPMSIGWEEGAEWEPATPEEIARSEQPGTPPEWPEDPEPEYGEDLVAAEKMIKLEEFVLRILKSRPDIPIEGLMALTAPLRSTFETEDDQSKAIKLVKDMFGTLTATQELAPLVLSTPTSDTTKRLKQGLRRQKRPRSPGDFRHWQDRWEV